MAAINLGFTLVVLSLAQLQVCAFSPHFFPSKSFTLVGSTEVKSFVLKSTHATRKPSPFPVTMQQRPTSSFQFPSYHLAAAVSVWSASAEIASAKDGAFGLLETSWAGMLHPVGMFILYGLTWAAGYHGLQWRRARSVGQQISELKGAGGSEADIAALQQLRSGEASREFHCQLWLCQS